MTWTEKSIQCGLDVVFCWRGVLLVCWCHLGVVVSWYGIIILVWWCCLGVMVSCWCGGVLGCCHLGVVVFCWCGVPLVWWCPVGVVVSCWCGVLVVSWCGGVLLVWWAKWTCMYVACCIVFFRFLLQVIGKCAETLSREKVAVGASACDTQFLLQQVTHLMLYITHMFQSGEKGLAHGNKSHTSCSTSPTCSSHGNKSHTSFSTSPTCSSQVKKG